MRLIVFLLVAVSCVSISQASAKEPRCEAKQKTILSHEQVVTTAEETAKAQEYNLEEYKRTGCVFFHEEGAWTVFYEFNDAIPGGHFSVLINDKTKEATLHHGL